MLRGALAVACPALECGEFLYEEGEGLEEDEVAMYTSLLPRTLATLPGGGVCGGSIVGVTDQLQNLHLRLIVQHKVRWGAPSGYSGCNGRAQEHLDEEAHPEGYMLQGAVPTVTEEAQQDCDTAEEEGDADDVVVVSDAARGKRARRDHGDDEQAKRARVGDVVELD